EFITGGDGEPGLVRDRFVNWRSEIIAEMKTRQGNQVVEIHPNLPDIYRRKVSNLQEVLEDETARPQAGEIIRSLSDPDRGPPRAPARPLRGRACRCPGSDPGVRQSKYRRPYLFGSRRYVLDGCGGWIWALT